MSKKILVTGSTTGIGKLTAEQLLKNGNEVVVHARNEQRAENIKKELPNIKGIVIGDLSDLDQTKKMAKDIISFGGFHTIIHNAGVSATSAKELLNVNVLSPYLLTALVDKPKQLIYLASDMHTSGSLKLNEMEKANSNISYSDSKLQILTFAMGLSRLWKNVRVNAIDPGWVPTRMSNFSAPDSLEESFQTQVELIETRNVTGQYLYHKKPVARIHSAVHDVKQQEALIQELEKVTGVKLPKE